MTLVSRVSSFFLAALAAALVGYSALFYYFASRYLYDQFDGDLHNALRLLSASVEVETDDAKWHPAEHGIDLQTESLSEVTWVVADERGQVVDRSRQLARDDPSDAAILAFAQESHGARDAENPVELGSWRLLRRELDAPTPKPLALREPHEYAGVRITVAKSVTDLNQAVNRLALLVCALPAALWLVAAVVGRWLVRHALAPVRDMAQSARSMIQADFGLRLPIGPSHDELSELGNEFNHLLDQLQSAFDRQHRFTGDAAHQLRNPLAVLQGQIDVALRRPRSNDEYQQSLMVLSEQTAELRQIVESLLFLARAEGDALPPQSEPMAVGEWLERFADRWDGHPRRSDLTIDTKCRARVSASEPLVNQLVDNLVRNALNYSEPGSPVTVAAHQRDGRVELAVRDRGAGIPASEQAAIFEPFYRSPTSRRAGVAGTGLGLPVAAQIAAALGGTLRCESVVGEGSKFTLSLPAIC